MPYREKQKWGTFIWGFLHTITIIDFDDSNTNKKFGEEKIKIIKELRNTIPCKHCIKIYDLYLDKLNNININESMALFKWGWELHNSVNSKLTKNEISYEEALNIWTSKI